MEIRRFINSNSGLIILSISLIISSIILTQNKVTYQDHNYLNNIENRVKLSVERSGFQIPVGINTTSNDVTYKSGFKIGAGERLLVILSNGTSEKIVGDKIVANYYHVSKLLIVEYTLKGVTLIKYYNSPIKWSNEL